MTHRVPPDLPFSPACERNKAPILKELARVLRHSSCVVEIGSGTGQHAVHFAEHLPHLTWQPTELKPHLAGIDSWRKHCPQSNLLAPIALDMSNPPWAIPQCDAFFTANTLHIVAWSLGKLMINECGKTLSPGGQLIIYGPFNYDGHYTSDSNAQFDIWLKKRDPASAIREIEKVVEIAESAGLHLNEDNDMPANNRLLVFEKQLSH